MECNEFRNKPIEEKTKIVNFLSKGHGLKHCKSQHCCKVSGCNQQHTPCYTEKKTPEASTNKLAISEVNQTNYL